MVNPVTVVVVLLVARTCPLDAVTVYPVIAVPPVFAGALHDTVTWVFPATAFTPVGTPGAEAGVTALDGLDAVEVPIALVAVTVNV